MSRHQPALLGGVFIGVLSSLPFVLGLNACCCLWVVLGGVLTAYLQQQNKATPIDAAEAVLGGLIAGLVGAVIATIATFAFSGFNAAMVQEQMRQQLESNPQVTPEMRDMMLRFFAGRNIMLLGAAIQIPLFAVFGMLGALLGMAIFKKKVPPAPPAPLQA